MKYRVNSFNRYPVKTSPLNNKAIVMSGNEILILNIPKK